MRLKTWFGVAAVFLCAAPAAEARLVRTVSHQELFDKADLIVLARPVTKTAETGETTTFKDILQRDELGNETNVVAVGAETTFDVSLIIKGDCPSRRFVLHHYREPPHQGDGPPPMNGPGTVSFDPSDPKRRSDILLFLVKEQDGRYAPYGGQTDPGMTSIFALEYPP